LPGAIGRRLISIPTFLQAEAPGWLAHRALLLGASYPRATAIVIHSVISSCTAKMSSSRPVSIIKPGAGC
jgi:hypothetical protein